MTIREISTANGTTYEFRAQVRRRGSKRDCLRLASRWRAAWRSANLGGEAATIRESLPRFLRQKEKRDRLAPATVRWYARTLERIANDLADRSGASLIGDIGFDRITFDLLEEWQIARGEQVAPGTANNELSALKHLGRCAIRWGAWNADAASVAWMHLEPIRERPKHPRALPEPDFVRLLSALPEPVRLVLVGMAATGDRPGALVAATWADVRRPDGDRPGALSLVRRKGYRPRVVSIWPGGLLDVVLRRCMDRFIARRRRPPAGCDAVFCNSRGRGWSGVAGLDNSVRHHVARADLPRRLKKFTPDAVRHSLITWAAMDGLSTYERQMLAGHESEQTCRVYTHASGLVADRERRAMEERLGKAVLPVLTGSDVAPVFLDGE